MQLVADIMAPELQSYPVNKVVTEQAHVKNTVSFRDILPLLWYNV